MDDFIGDYLFPGAAAIIFLALGVAVAVVSCEGIQSLRTRHKVFACESRNLDAVRLMFGTEVVCRARNMGSDTLNLITVP